MAVDNLHCRVQAVTEMVGEKGLEKVNAEFTKLYYAMKQVQSNEVRLTQKSRQLNEEIAGNVGKVSAALAMTQEEQLANVETHRVRRCLRRRFDSHSTAIRPRYDYSTAHDWAAAILRPK